MDPDARGAAIVDVPVCAFDAVGALELKKLNLEASAPTPPALLPGVAAPWPPTD